MAGSVNKVILVGNLGRDPEIRRNAQGEPIASLSLATSETWRDKQSGERKERTEWHRVVIFNESLAKVAEQYLKKGSKVYVEGQLATRKWQDQQGVEKYTTEIVLQRFRGELTLLDKAERDPPSPDDYGSTRTRDNSAGYAAAKDGDNSAGYAAAKDGDNSAGYAAAKDGDNSAGYAAAKDGDNQSRAPTGSSHLDDDIPF